MALVATRVAGNSRLVQIGCTGCHAVTVVALPVQAVRLLVQALEKSGDHSCAA